MSGSMRSACLGDDVALTASSSHINFFALLPTEPANLRHWHGFALRRQVYRCLDSAIDLQTPGSAFADGGRLR